MRKHRLGKLLLIVLCVSLLVFLAGCRPSPVLEQIIYEQNHQVDPDTETKTMNDDLENEEPDEDIPSRETVDDSEQTKDQEYTSALAGDEDTDSEDPYAVYDVAYSPSGDLSVPAETNPTADSTSDTATGSTKTGGDEGGNAPSGEGEEPGNDGMSAGDSGGGTSAGDGQSGGGNGNGEGDITSGDEYQNTGDETNKQIVDENNGETVEPVAGSRVTAVGEAATIVEMLGSKGQLVGTSSSFYDNSLEQKVFAEKGASEVPVWWDGDGSSECREFRALLDAHPDVCFEISGQGTFSEVQIAALNDAGIAYTVLPQLNSIANIKSAVTIVGQVLGNHSSEGGTDAERIASDYCNWADNMISLAGGGSKKYTAYIVSWADNDYWDIFSTGGTTLTDGYGLPVGAKNAKTWPLNECMTAANIENESVDGYYVEPLHKIYWGPRISNQSAKYNENIFTIRSTETADIALGTADYPYVIVANGDILQSMLSGSGNYFYYHWTPGKPYFTGGTWESGFDDLIGDDQRVSTYIKGAYDILVNPSGVGSWANGSVESPLEAVWLSSMFQNNGDIGSVESEVRNFYSTFYGYDGVDTSVIFPSSYYVPVP